ncbi:MAG: hypothetical protein ACYC0V_21855, partial [Armatimonadota bacterium]
MRCTTELLMVSAILTCLLSGRCCVAAIADADDRFVPIDGMVIYGVLAPSEAESLAVGHFNKEIALMTGKALPVAWGNLSIDDHPTLVIGNAATHPSLASRLKYVSDLKGADDDVLNQSYLIASDIHEDHISINALGFGRKRAAREMLGLSYALGDLLRRLDIRGGT